MAIIGITGGTGLIGRHIAARLINNGHRVVVLTRNATGRQPGKGISYALWNSTSGQCDTDALSSLDAVIHLAGESIAAKRWTNAQKNRIAASRIEGTKFLVHMIRTHGNNCKAIIAASAIGYYAPDATPLHPSTEFAAAGTDFLANTTVRWEEEINKAQHFARTVIIRNGVVLAKEGGAFPRLVQPAPFSVLPIPGNGRQILSWIHIDDMAALYIHALEQQTMHGVYNGVAPQPTSYNALIDTIARLKGGFFMKPHVPAPMLKIALGEMATELLKSCTVNPHRTLASGFSFQYPDIGSALRNLLT